MFALVVAGSVLGVIGFALSGRRWYCRADLPPDQLARLKWEQGKAAAGAGAGAWRVVEDGEVRPAVAVRAIT